MRFLIIAGLAAVARAESGFLGNDDGTTTAIFACQERLTGCAMHWNAQAACVGVAGCVWTVDGCFNSSDIAPPTGDDDLGPNPAEDDDAADGGGCGQHDDASACNADANCDWSDGADTASDDDVNLGGDIVNEAFCDVKPCEQRSEGQCSDFCVWANNQCTVAEAPGIGGSGDTDDTISNIDDVGGDDLDGNACAAVESQNECGAVEGNACVWDSGETAPLGDDTNDDDPIDTSTDPFCRSRGCTDTDSEAGCVGDCTWDAANDMCDDNGAGPAGPGSGSGDLDGSGVDDVDDDFCLTIEGQSSCSNNASCVWRPEETFEDPLGGGEGTTTEAYCSQRTCRDEDTESSCAAAERCEWDAMLDGCEDSFDGEDGECPGSGDGSGGLDDDLRALDDDGAETESPGPDVDDDDYSNDGVEGDDLDGGATDGCNVFSRAQCSFPCNWTVIRDMEMPGSGLDNDFQDPCAEEEGEGFCQNTTLRSELEDNDGSGEDDVDPVDPGSGSGGPTTGDDDGGVDSVCFGLDSASACRANAECAWGGMSTPEMDDAVGGDDVGGVDEDESCRPKSCDERDSSICAGPICEWDQDADTCSFPDSELPGSGDLPGSGSGLPDVGDNAGDADGCYEVESEIACTINANCTWGSTMSASDDDEVEPNDSIEDEATCGPRPCGQRDQNICFAPICAWSGSTCAFSEGGGDPPGSGTEGSGDLVGPDGEAGPEDPCLQIQSESACAAGDCVWREMGAGDDEVGVALPGDLGTCTSRQCVDLDDASACNAYGEESCFWVVARDGVAANCADNLVSFQPDRSRCFRIRDESACRGTAGCIFDTVTSRGHCRGPCHTQTAEACSVGCIADLGVDGTLNEAESTCVSIDDADCNAFAEGSCPADRCDFRATMFDCPFSECGRGSPCANEHMCSTGEGGFNAAGCCTALQAYCQVSGDAACFSDRVKGEIQERFSCEIAPASGSDTDDVEISRCYSDRDGALYDEAVCNSLENCTFRPFLGSGATPGITGYCDEIGCQDFPDRLACTARAREGCVYKPDDNVCVYEEGQDSELGEEDGSGEDSSGEDDGAHYADSCDELSNNNAACSASSACVVLTQEYEGSGGIMVSQDFCVAPGCNTQLGESDCESYSDATRHDDDMAEGCEWTSGGFCVQIESDLGSGNNGGSGGDSTACWAQQNHNQETCESNSCVWTEDAESTTNGGYCSEFSCDNLQSANHCSANGLCTWTTVDGSDGYCGATNGDGGNGEACNTDDQSSCGDGCTWFEDDESGTSYCIETACGIIDDETACTTFSEACRWVNNVYTGPGCIDTNGNDAGDSFDEVDLTPYTIQCERFLDEQRCSQYSFCEFVAGGPGCKALTLQCEIEADISCYEYDQYDECNSARGCNFVPQGDDFVCAAITTTARPSLPSYGEICPSGTSFEASHQFYPSLFLGRLGLFACGEVYSVGLAYESVADVTAVLQSQCCRAPETEAPPTSPPPTTAEPNVAPVEPPTTAAPTQPPQSSSPTAGPIVNGGNTLDIIFDNVPFATMTELEQAYFRYGVQYTLASRMAIPTRRVLRVDLVANGAGGVVATVTFDYSVDDAAVQGAHNALGATPLGVSVGGETYRSESSVPLVDGTRRPTPAPQTASPTYPSSTLSPTPAPQTASPTYPSGTLNPTPPPVATPAPSQIGNGDGDVAASTDDGKDFGTNTMIIIIAVAVLITAVCFFAISIRSKNAKAGKAAPIRATHTNPVYAKGIVGPSQGAGKGVGGGSGLVRVESMC